MAATNTTRQKKSFWKLLPKQLHVSSANVEGLEMRPSLAAILLWQVRVSTGFSSFITQSMAILHLEKGREICSEFVILSVSNAIYRLLGTSLGVTVFEIGCSLFRAQDVAISIRHIAQHYNSWGFSLYPSVGTHCSCLPYRSWWPERFLPNTLFCRIFLITFSDFFFGCFCETNYNK